MAEQEDDMGDKVSPSVEKFCPDCGRPLLQPDSPHAIRQCDDCERSYPTQTADDASGGITIRDGDRFVIPKGWLKLSLDRSVAPGQFTRYGMTWFVERLVFEGLERTPEKIGSWLEELDRRGDEIIDDSLLFYGLDLSSPKDEAAGLKILEENKNSEEWWATMLGAGSSQALEAIEGGDATKAAWAAYFAAKAHTMLVFKRELEELTWRGYTSHDAAYDLAAHLVGDEGPLESIVRARSALEDFDEATLYALVHSTEEIGPKLGVTDIAEDVLRPLATYQLEKIGEMAAKRRENLRYLFAGMTAGGTLLGAVIGLLQFLT